MTRWMLWGSMAAATVFGGCYASHWDGDDADDIVPSGHSAAEWYAPYEVEVISGVCPPEAESCGTVERQAIQLGEGGSFVWVFNGGVGHYSSMSLLVTQAHRYTEMRCDDVPDQFYSALFLNGF